jgi:hypothetical protein
MRALNRQRRVAMYIRQGTRMIRRGVRFQDHVDQVSMLFSFHHLEQSRAYELEVDSAGRRAGRESEKRVTQANGQIAAY